MHVRNAELECVRIAGDVTCEQRVAGEIAIEPECGFCVAKNDLSVYSCRMPKGARSVSQYVW